MPEYLTFIVPEEPGSVPLLVQLLLLDFVVDLLKLASLNTPDALSNCGSVRPLGVADLGEGVVPLGLDNGLGHALLAHGHGLVMLLALFITPVWYLLVKDAGRVPEYLTFIVPEELSWLMATDPTLMASSLARRDSRSPWFTWLSI